VAPDGDWRAFVTRYLPEMELEGVEAYNAFNQMDKPETPGAEGARLQDLNM
jgi:hypothetical protein